MSPTFSTDLPFVSDWCGEEETWFDFLPNICLEDYGVVTECMPARLLDPLDDPW